MILAKIRVSGVRALPVEILEIPQGIIGGKVRFEYTDPMWDGLTKTVVFKGAVTKDVVDAGDLVDIPPETVERKGVALYVGVYGTDADNNIAIPTLWAYLGCIRAAADPSGDESTDESLPVWAQLQEQIDDLKQSGTGNGGPGTPGIDGEDGGYYTPAVTQPDANTVQFDFAPSKADMPAVEPVKVSIPSSGGNVDLTGYATEQFVRDGYQPKGNYLTAVPDGYAKTEDIPVSLPNPNALTFTGAVSATYDGSNAVTVEIPNGGGGEWKMLTHAEITEDDVSELVITETTDGEAFSITEFIVLVKAVPREDISSLKVFGSKNSTMTLLQTNAFGNKTTAKYLVFTYLKFADTIRAEFMEGNYDIFKSNGVSALAASVYAPGVQYYKQSHKIDSYLRIAPTNGFLAGDIVEVWYR